MLMTALVLAAALLLAVLSYAGPGASWGRDGLPGGLRAVAWASLGLLLLNPSCPAAPANGRPLVLLDGSLSMIADGGRWREAADSARRWGEVRPFGDPGAPPDTLLRAGASRLGEALDAALATGRPVIVVTDGEVEDGVLLGDRLAGATVRLFPREAVPAAGIETVEAPPRLGLRDTLRVRVGLRVARLTPQRLGVALRLGERELARGGVDVSGDGTHDLMLAVPPGRLPPGDHVLQAALVEQYDAEPRDDSRLVVVVVSPVPGIAVLASPADWEARFLVRALREVTSLPVAAYARLEREGWRRMDDLRRVPDSEVQQAAARADLLVVRGAPPPGPRRGRAILEWPAADAPERPTDWYLASGPGGPIPGALVGIAVDSLPPATALSALSADSPAWVGLTAQLGRRGPVRPAMAGYLAPGERRVVLAAEGLWRWAFRGGSSEQAYRSLLAATAEWLLAAPDPSRGAAAPVRAVVPQGRPLPFVRAGPDSGDLEIRLQAAQGEDRVDTLRFGPDGRAGLRLPPGTYRYQVPRGAGVVAVETWSPEWFPGPVTVAAREAAAPPAPGRQRGARDLGWLYALGVTALLLEWAVRRRRGLR